MDASSDNVDFNRMQADSVTAFDDFACGPPK
jgi:hypothetical protein